MINWPLIQHINSTLSLRQAVLVALGKYLEVHGWKQVGEQEYSKILDGVKLTKVRIPCSNLDPTPTGAAEAFAEIILLLSLHTSVDEVLHDIEGLLAQDQGADAFRKKEKSMSQSPRIPSPELVRQALQGLKEPLAADERESREEILQLAQERIEQVLPGEVRQALASFPPQVIEAYGLLLRWQAERGQYPQSTLAEVQDEKRVDVQPTVQTTSTRRAYSSPDGSMKFEADTDEEQQVLDALFGGAVAGEDELDEAISGEKQDTIQDAFQSAATILTALHNQSQAAHQPTATFQAGPKMTLDTFQGVYKGVVTVIEGKGKRATSTSKVIAVHKEVYEAEKQKLSDEGRGQAIDDPTYWLPKRNHMTVYFSQEEYEIEVAWLLGDYDSAITGIPRGMKPAPEQIAQYFDEPDEWEEEIIKRNLRTPQQKAWLDQHDLTITNILEGRTPLSLSSQIISLFFQDWNAKLGKHVFGH